MKLKQVAGILEKNFPINLAESWDNVGILVGEEQKEISKIQISLDLTLEVIENAVKNEVDLIITHHPFIFSPLKKINNSSIEGKKILKLIQNNIAVYTLHTNLDSAKDGLNSYIAEKLGAANSKVISEQIDDVFKMAVYIPISYFSEIIEIINKSKNLVLNGYKNVSYSSTTEERLQFEDGINISESMKTEVLGSRNQLNALLNEIKKKHPYEEPAYEIIKTENKYPTGKGLGRYFSLEKSLKVKEYVNEIKTKLNIPNIKLVGDLESEIKKVAVVNGSGMSFLKKVLKIKADLFITGDIKYHEALDSKELGINLIDLGHYESEVFFSDLIIKTLRREKSLDLFVYNSEPVFTAI